MHNSGGNAVFHHDTYRDAEREAQAQHIGVWDQIAVNGSEVRNYAALGTWWQLRAAVIDEYRKIRPGKPDLLNSRLDFDEIKQRAENRETATVFTAIERIERVGQRHAIARIGSRQQPFNLFIRNVEEEPGQGIVSFLQNRYVSEGEDHPRRSYAYVRRELKLFAGDPEMELDSPEAVTNDFVE